MTDWGVPPDSVWVWGKYWKYEETYCEPREVKQDEMSVPVHEYVRADLHDAAQSRIAELEADRDKWRNECLAANESERKLFQRQAELEAESEALHRANIQLAKSCQKAHEALADSRDTAWNDAIEAAASALPETVFGEKYSDAIRVLRR